MAQLTGGPLTLFLSLQARVVEEGFVARWQHAGVQPPPHPLLSQPDAAAREAAFLHVQHQQHKAGAAADPL